MRILEVFDASYPALPISEIARRADLPVATAHRLVTALVRMGLLERDAKRQVRVGVRLWELAARSSVAVGLRATAMPYLEDLHAAVKQHTQLGVLEGKEVLYLELLSSRGAVVNITRIASRLPAHACSSGLVLLAYAPAETQEEALSSQLQRYTPKTVTDPTQLRRLLADVRRQGYAIADGFIHLDATGAAVPIRGFDGTVMATLSVIVPSGGGHAAAAIPALITASRGITRALGTTPQAPHPDTRPRSS